MLRPIYALFSVSLLWCSCATMALAEKGWRFKQTSHAIGRVEVLVTGKSLKVTGDKTGFVLVSQAPKWRVYAFNTRSHLICETTADQFAVKFAMVKHASTEMSRMIKARYNTPVKHIWNGITALEYEGRANGKLVTDIWRLPAVTITPQASQILSDLLQVPGSDTMTVRASVLQPRKQFKGLFYSYGDKKAFPEADEEHTETWLITESVQKVDVQDSDFKFAQRLQVCRQCDGSLAEHAGFERQLDGSVGRNLS